MTDTHFTQLLMDNIPICCYCWDEDFNIFAVNHEVARLFSLSDKKIFPKIFWDLSPDYQPNGQYSTERLKSMVMYAFEKGYNRFEWIHQTIKCEIIPCEITLIRTQHNNKSIVVSYTRDIRAQKAVINQMLEAEDCTKTMVNAMPLAASFWTKDGSITTCNDAAYKMFGLSNRDEFITRFFELSPQHQPDGQSSDQKANDLINKAFDEGYCQFEWMHQRLNGELVPSEVTLVRVKYRNEYRVAGYMRDLREQRAIADEKRKTELAEENIRTKNRFLAAISHEIRTPMNAILGITETHLQDRSLPSHLHEAFDTIYLSGHLLMGIVNDLLDMSIIDAGRLTIVPNEYKAADLISDTVTLNTRQFYSKPIVFVLEVDANVPETLMGDELRIKQILNNLISNSFKYTKRGEIKLAVHTEAHDDELFIAFTISDTGQGMSEEQVNMIFDEYTRFNLESNQTTQGTGLGMAITQNLIRLMGGEIDIHSKPNKGTVTTVRLPQQAVGAGIIGEALAKDLQAFCNVKPSKRKQIVIKPMPHVHALVVDDVETNLYTTKGLLATYEIKVSVARNGNEAIQLVKQGNQYDIIFMDHMMPKPDGIETTQILRKMLYTKPIVALTANAVLGQAEMFLQNGFDAYLSKPIDLTRLNHILHTLVKNQKETVKTSPPKAKPAAEVSPKKAMIFVSDAKRAIPYLENVYDLENYVIHAHAMKSALRDVHEMELSAFALILEKAGKKREISFIKTETPAFINKLRKVVEALSPAKS